MLLKTSVLERKEIKLALLFVCLQTKNINRLTLWVTLLVYSALSFADFSLVFRQTKCQAREWRKRVLDRDLMSLWRPSSETCRQLAICLRSWCGVGEPSVHWVRSLWVWFHWVGGGGWRTTSSLTSVGSSEIQTWVINQSLVVLLEVHLHEKLRTLPGQSWSGRYFGRSNNNNKTTNRKPQTRANNFLYKRAEVLLNTAQILYLYLTLSICPECLSTTCGRRAPESVLALAHVFFQIKRGPGKERSIQSCNLDPHPK